MPYMRQFLLIVCLLALVLVTNTASAVPDTPILTLVTTDQGSPRVNGHSSEIASVRPGWQIELLRMAAQKAGVRVKFYRMKWIDALKNVREGTIDAAFNSSYKDDRAVYGKYPMRDGELDTSRATLNYTYWLYYSETDPVLWNGVSFSDLKKPIAAERSSAIVPILKKYGADVVEAETYEDILKLMDSGQASAVAGFEGNVDIFMQTAPQHFGHVVRHPVPLVRRTGYVMFSKLSYDAHPDRIERFWDAIRDVWSSPAAIDIRGSYE